MPKLKTRYIISAVLLTLVILTGAVIVNTNWFWEYSAGRVLEQKVKGLRIKKLSISFHNIRWPRQFSFADAEFSGMLDKQLIHGSFDRFNVYFESFDRARVKITGVNLKRGDFAVDKADFSGEAGWNKNGLADLHGTAAAAQARIEPYLMTDISFGVSGNDQQLGFSDLQMGFCEGQISGAARIRYIPPPTYDLSLTLKGVNLKRLEETGLPYFSYARGIVDGDVALKTDLKTVEHFTAELVTMEQAQMKASIINFIVEAAGVKEKLFDERFALMVKQDEFVPLRTMRAKIINLNQNELQAQMDFQPRDYNVRVNAPVDIRIDEKVLESVFKNFMLK